MQQIVSEEPVGPSAALVVRTARYRAGMTQQRAAQHCGVSQSVFSDYERGARDPSLGTLRALIGPLGFDVALTLVRRVVDGNQLQGPIGAALRRHLDDVLAIMHAHGATRVWVVGRTVESLEDPAVDGLRFHADLPNDDAMWAVMGDVSELFGYRYPVTVDVAYLREGGGMLEPAPPFVELTASPGGTGVSGEDGTDAS